MANPVFFWTRDQVEIAVGGIDDLEPLDTGEVLGYEEAVNAYDVLVFRTMRRYTIRADQMVLTHRPPYSVGFREWE